MSNLNQYIKKSHLRMVERFNADLEAFREYTGDAAAVLYEDAYTSFTLANVRVENGCLQYEYDGKLEQEAIVLQDEDTKEYYEEEYDDNSYEQYADEYDGISEWIKFWRACLRRAKRYWEMDTDTLDAIQSGEKEDNEDDEE